MEPQPELGPSWPKVISAAAPKPSQSWPSVPTAHDEINYFLFLQTTQLISSASDWKFNPAGSCLQFQPKKPQVIRNWPSDYLITVCVLGLEHFFSLVRPLPLPSVQRPLSWGSFNLELCNNILEDREDEKLELVNQRVQLSFELEKMPVLHNHSVP